MAGGPKKDEESLGKEVADSSKGTELAACVIVGLLLGLAFKRFLPATNPWGFFTCLLLGIVAGFWQLFR